MASQYKTTSAWQDELIRAVAPGTYPTLHQIVKECRDTGAPVKLHYTFDSPEFFAAEGCGRLLTGGFAKQIVFEAVYKAAVTKEAVRRVRMERIIHDHPDADKVPAPEDQDVKQMEVKINANDWLHQNDLYSAIAASWWATDRAIPMRTLASLKAGPDLWQHAKFPAVIIGLEPRKAVPCAYYLVNTNADGKRELVPVASYEEKRHGAISEIMYEDVQWYLIEEAGSSSNPRRLPIRVYDPHVDAYDIGTPVEIIAEYCAGDTSGRTVKKKEGRDPAELDYWLSCITARKTKDTAPPILTPDAADRIGASAAGGTLLDDLVASFAPHITGNRTAKLLCLICAAGGTPLAEYRAELHGYLVGSPGTGKSEMIKAAARLRGPTEGCYADAANASSRGLLYGQEDFQRHRILKAGLFVRHKLVCLDELPNMPPAQIHDVNTTLEQQVVSYHKAGFDRDTPVNVSLVAAGNPADQTWNPQKTVMENLAPIPAPLISRMLITRVDHTDDTAARLRHVVSVIGGGTDAPAPPFTEDELVAHMHRVRNKITPPTFSAEATAVLERFVIKQSSLTRGRDDVLPMETRQHIDLIRVALAIARLHAAPEATAAHMVQAIRFFSACLQSLGIPTAALDADEDARVPSPPSGTTPPTTAPQRKMNRRAAFRAIFAALAAPTHPTSATGSRIVYERDLISAMKQSPTRHWSSDGEAHDYLKKELTGDEIYEPSPGTYRRVDEA